MEGVGSEFPGQAVTKTKTGEFRLERRPGDAMNVVAMLAVGREWTSVEPKWQGGGRRAWRLRCDTWRVMALTFSVFEDFYNHARVFDAGNDPQRTAAQLTSLDVDPEHALEALRPGHGLVFFGLRSVVPGGKSFTSARRGDLLASMAIGCENPVKPCEVDPWSGYQRGTLNQCVIYRVQMLPFGMSSQ